jgi:hypothetical protein
LRELGLAETGERDELAAESGLGGAALPDGWYTVVFDRYDHPLLGDDVLNVLSDGCELVAAGAEEHVMVSFAEGWRDGARTWSVTHDSEQGIEHLDAAGALPESFQAIRSERLAEQEAAGGAEADVDYVFDVPLEVARLITGFSHVETEPDDGFAVLVETAR